MKENARNKNPKGHSLLMFILQAIIMAFLFTPPALTATWIVDDDGGPGVDFTDIPPAIAAASACDLILVRSGDYSGFILAEGLTLAADTGESPVIKDNGATIKDIPAGHQAVLTGFSMEYLYIHDCHGVVHVDGSYIGLSRYQAALRVFDCERVILSRASFMAKHEYHKSGAKLRNATVLVSECLFQGSNGADGYYSDGGDGSPAVHSANTTVFLQSSTARGGNGGDAWWDDWKIFHGGDGAPGILLENTYMELFGHPGNLISGGYGGRPSNWFAFYGEDANAVYGVNSDLYHSGCQFKTSSLNTTPPPIFGGVNSQFLKIIPEVPVMTLNGTGQLNTSISVDLHGLEKSFYMLLLSPATGVLQIHHHVFTHLLLDPNLLITLIVGTIPASGVVPHQMTIPMMPSLQGIPVYFQSFVETDTGKQYLSTSAGFVIR